MKFRWRTNKNPYIIMLFPEGATKFWWDLKDLEFVNIAAQKIWAIRLGGWSARACAESDALQMHMAECEDWLHEIEGKYKSKGVTP